MLDKPRTIKLAILADTHIPDRIRKLPPDLLSSLKARKIDWILHAGDASSWKVVNELEKIAPVTIVQGNRDWFFGMKTPRKATLTIHGVQIAMAHGHQSIFHYLFDKWASIRLGYQFERYYQPLQQNFPQADVIIFGHTHHQTASWVNGQLFFNPGAAYPCRYNRFKPQFGIISITSEGVIRSEFHHLD